MGCQTEIASAIIDKDTDYILVVKGNQSQLLENIQDKFRFRKTIKTSLSEELDHGRKETRKCSVLSDLQFIPIENN